MDGITLYASLFECDALIDGKIDKIQMPEPDMLLFTVRNKGVNYKLLISSNPDSGRIQLTEDTFPNPSEAPLFCMLLRKRLQGGIINSIVQSGVDRVVTFSISSRDDFGDPSVNRLIVEIMGKHSNIILVDRDGIIIDSIKHVGPTMSSVRTLLPGIPFHYMPEQEKCNPFDISLEEYIALYTSSPSRFDKTLSDRVSGVSKALSNVILNMTKMPPVFFHNAMSTLKAGIIHPCVILGESGEPVYCLPFEPDSSSDVVLRFPSLSNAIDHYYSERNIMERIARHGHALRSAVSSAISKSEKKLALHTEAILSEKQYEQYKLFGELITANLYQMRKGQPLLKAINYYAEDTPEVIIPLDPLLSPVDNAQKYFRRYKKALRASEYARSQIEIVTEELNWLRSEQGSIETCETINELNEIKNELIREGYIKEHGKRTKVIKQPSSRPMLFTSGDGVSIIVGKNNLQNDRVTSSAAPDAIWLHVKNAPGSHVIIQSHGLPSDNTLSEAVMLAAYYSSQRNGVSVAVDYTLKKYVKKPSGARPGYVIYSTNKTAYITPDKLSVKKIHREV